MTSLPVTTDDFQDWSAGRWTVRPGRLLQLALIVFAIGNVGRVPLLDLGARQAPILINDIAIMALAVAGLLAMGAAGTMKLTDVSLAAIVFAAIGGLSAVSAIPRFGLSSFEVIASLAYLARWCAYFTVYLVVVNCVRANDIDRTWRTIEGVMLAMAVFGLVQSAFLPDFAFMVFKETAKTEWDAQGNRLVSTILDPNVMAGLINIVLLVQLARLASGERLPLWKPMLLVVALCLTLSRGGILSLGVGVAVILAVRRPTKRLARLAAMSVAGVLMASPMLVKLGIQYTRFTVTDDSALARVVSWRQAIGVFLENPWFGIGFNTYGFVQARRGFERIGANTYSAEGGLLFIAVMTGLVGLAVYLVMLWCVFRRCRRGWAHPDATPSERALFLGVAAATVATLVQTIFVNTLLVPFTMELLWVLWGLTFVALVAIRERTMSAAPA